MNKRKLPINSYYSVWYLRTNAVADPRGSNPAMPPQSGHGIHCGQLILRKISKICAIRCQILRLKCTKFDFRWGSAPDPAGRAYSAPPDLLAVFKGPTSKEREEKERKKGKKRAGEEKGGESWHPNWGVWIHQ